MPILEFVVHPGAPFVWDNADLCSQTGSGDVLSDDDNATYVSSQYDNTDDDHPRAGIWAAELAPAVPSWIFDLPPGDFGVVSGAVANHDGDSGLTPPMFLRFGTLADGPNFSAGMDDLISTTIDTYNNPLTDGLQLDFSTLVDGTAVVFFASNLEPDPGDIGPAENLYEFVVVVSYLGPDFIPKTYPCRIHPRDDELAAGSAARIWPTPRSQQSSNRRAGGYY